MAVIAPIQTATAAVSAAYSIAMQVPARPVTDLATPPFMRDEVDVVRTHKSCISTPELPQTR